MQAEVTALLGPDRAPPGALRIYARCGDREVLVIHGEERIAQEGERLAVIEWFSSVAVAEAVSHECSRFLIAAQTSLDHGWHAFPVEHLPKLVRVVRDHLNVTYHPATEPSPRQGWTSERDAQLCFQAGRGRTAKAIAEHALVRSTEGAVFKRAQRLGIPLSATAMGQVTIRRLPAAVVAALDRGAEREQLTRESFASKLLIDAIAADQRHLAAAG